MGTAVKVRDGVAGFAGPGTLYRLAPSWKGTEHVLLYYRPPMHGQGGQLSVILATPNGASLLPDVRPQPGSYVTDQPDHALALRIAGGYEIVEAAPQPEAGPEPSFDPGEHTVADVNDYLAGTEPVERERVLALEAGGKARKTILGRWQS